MVTPAASIDHQSLEPGVGPTAKAPASGATFHVPAKSDGADGSL